MEEKKIKTVKINDEKVGPVPQIGKETDKRPIKHADLFKELAPNIVVLSRKGSGKSSLIYKILKSAIVPGVTKVVIVCSTINRCETWKNILKHLDKKGVDYETYMDLKDEDGENIIRRFLDQNNEEIDNDGDSGSDSDDEPGGKMPKKELLICADDSDDEKPRKPKRSKWRPLKYIFIFDDMGNQLRDKAIEQLVKTNRHRSLMTIQSSQWPSDLKPENLKQAGAFLLFGGHAEDKIKKLWSDGSIGIPFERFHKLYLYATKEPYGFLYAGIDNDFRINFDHRFENVC